MTIGKGTTTTIDSTASADGLDSARISDTQMLVAYLDSVGILGARVCDINTGTKAITPNAQSSITHGFQLREISLVRLSSTKFLFVSEVGRAQVLNVSGTTVTGGPIATLTDDPSFGVIRLIPITSTTALYTYGIGSDILARVLSVDGSDNVTESSSVIAANATSLIGIYDSALYTSTKAVVVFQDDASSNFYLMGQLLTISGATVALDGSAQTLYNANQGWNSSCAAAEISSTEIVTAHNVTTGGGSPEKLACHVITLSGSTLSAGSTLDIALADFIEPQQAVATNTATILLNGGTSATNRVTQITKNGTTLSHTASDFVDITVNTRIILDSMKKIADDFALVCTLGSADGTVIGSDVAPPLSTAFRFLGFDADNENLYASGLKDATTLQLFDYDLPTLTEGGTASFGSGTDAEIDARTRGIFPVIKPMADQVLYLRGRDGNNVQVQYNDQNGTLGWIDVGPGTATWGTAKYAAALLTAPTYTDDVIAVFSDDDIYRTRFGTETWVKMGDAGTNLRAAARHIGNRFNEILVGGIAAGTAEWSNNFGASFGDVSGTALGTINAFEVSL